MVARYGRPARVCPDLAEKEALFVPGFGIPEDSIERRPTGADDLSFNRKGPEASDGLGEAMAGTACFEDALLFPCMRSHDLNVVYRLERDGKLVRAAKAGEASAAGGIEACLSLAFGRRTRARTPTS